MLGCAPGDVDVYAVRVSDGERDETASGSLGELWSANGGLDGLVRELSQQLRMAGMATVESVPGARGRGVAQVCPFDPLTTDFRRDAELRLVLRQKQAGAPGDGFVDLDPTTVFHRGLRATADNPYGRSMYGSALTEILRDLARTMDVGAALHLVGSPRYDVSVKFFGFLAQAMKPLSEGGTGLSFDRALETAQKMLEDTRDTVGTLLTDDAFVHTDDAATEVLSAGSAFTGMEPVLIVFRQRLSQALKTPGTLLGISDGSTDTYSTKELEVYGKGLATVRGIVLELVWEIAALHLRLLGLACRPKIDAKPIRTVDALAEAQARKAEIDNEFSLVRAGMRSEDDASQRLTGSGLSSEGEARAKAYFSAPAPATDATSTTIDGKTGAVSFRRGGKRAA